MSQRAQVNESSIGEVSTSRRWAEYLVAILAGNIIFLFLEPRLPIAMQHRMFRVDLGLAVDFLICVAAYGVVRLFQSTEAQQES